MPRLKLTLEYDGTDFVGWQAQPNGRSVQAVIEQALAELLGQPVRVQVAGRTDSGVHASGQVVAFGTERVLPLEAYRGGVNRLLPQDVAVIKAEEVPEAFDPRRWALGRRYRYLISRRPSRSPLRRRTHWELFAPLDLGAMREATRALVGRHDFSAFRAADCQALHAVRELRTLSWVDLGEDAWAFEVEGTAFLKHMVRNLTGTLVEVGKGRQPPEWVGHVLRSKDRTKAGATAPAHGLCLVEVRYGEGPHPGAEEDEE